MRVFRVAASRRIRQMNSLLNVIGDIYEASFNPSHWNQVARALCQLFDAHSCGIMMEDFEFKYRDIIGSHGLPAATTLGYRLGLAKYDLTFQLQAKTAPGHAEQLVDAREFQTTHPIYYRLILKPHNVGYLGTMGIYNDDEWHVGVALHRSFESHPFGQDELQQLELLYPHFQRALRIQKELFTLRDQRHALQEALGQLSLGLLMVDPEGRVTYQNPLATALLDFHQGLKVTPEGYVQAHVQSEHKQLLQLLDQVANRAYTRKTDRQQVIALHHLDQRHAMQVLITRLEEPPHPLAQGKIALYLSVPHAPCNLSAESLHQLYGLTPAEAGVAIALANGLSPAEISRANGVSVETVRSQLKSIFTKMGVNKQQDVIRVLLSGFHHIS